VYQLNRIGSSYLGLSFQAVAGGAARYKVAESVALSERTLKCWRRSGGRVAGDQRPDAEQVEQRHKLTQAEKLAIFHETLFRTA